MKIIISFMGMLTLPSPQIETNDASSADEEFVEKEQPIAKKQKSKAVGQKRKRAAAVAGDDESGGEKHDNEESTFELSNKRRIFVKPFSNGQPSVDIRAVWFDKENEMKYGKQGITLPLAQWERLKELMPEIDEAIKKIKN
ncbi:hypothetical protein BDB00DRAFT_783724 [Zychaea mexicana]|uniref:uncharacterized protein n=1 Tax=Zychaea mexicana TaxID=64656 RepID=UPI0022FDFEA2|nr:uncharacterized protein BDB00DRAFT_783724 [Zychaea mexicana]KAI9498582.1 hypothetical protein BDB00DRAFT_783724 [Zychaea mexicana]